MLIDDCKKEWDSVLEKKNKPQKYEIGDYVKVVGRILPGKSHYKYRFNAIVLGSYVDKYRASNYEDFHTYSIIMKNGNSISWYEESELELIDKGRFDLLLEYKREWRKSNWENINE